MVNQIGGNLVTWWNEYGDNVTPIIVGVLSAWAACLMYDAIRLWHKKTDMRDRMSVEGKGTKSTISWLITEALEEAVCLDIISEKDRDFWYQRIGSRCDLKDLLPQNSRIKFPDKEILKKMIRGRLKNPPRRKLKSLVP